MLMVRGLCLRRVVRVQQLPVLVLPALLLVICYWGVPVQPGRLSD